MKISKHISYKEAIKSNTALRLNLDNTPGDYEISNMVGIATHLFDPVNTAIGGSKSSQHCQGRAIDLDDTFGYKTNADMFNYIKNNLNFDQMIWEFGNDKNPAWVHVSYVSGDQNRNRILIAEKVNGKTNYRIE